MDGRHATDPRTTENYQRQTAASKVNTPEGTAARTQRSLQCNNVVTIVTAQSICDIPLT